MLYPVLCQVLTVSRSQWPPILRRGSAAVHLLRLRIWMLPGTWISLSCDCCVLSGRGLCNGLITHPDESYRVWCVVSVIVKHRNWGGPDPLGAVAPRKRLSVYQCVVLGSSDVDCLDVWNRFYCRSEVSVSCRLRVSTSADRIHIRSCFNSYFKKGRRD